MKEPFSASERSELLLEYAAAIHEYNSAMEAERFDETERLWRRARGVEERYFSRLPRLAMACCPFDHKPLIRSFDPYGLDGLWWRSDASPEEAPSCPHFCVLLGAVNFAGRPPRAGAFEVHPGPQVPYLIPRLLKYPEVVAVIARLKMKNGYIAYPVAYFAERRPAPQELTAGWARANFVYRTALGESGWKVPDDPWDFDLVPWLKTGRVRWCPLGGDNTVLSGERPERCPYLNLPGERQGMIVRGDSAFPAGVPSGRSLPPEES